LPYGISIDPKCNKHRKASNNMVFLMRVIVFQLYIEKAQQELKTSARTTEKKPILDYIIKL
jgi:hypothetical protein